MLIYFLVKASEVKLDDVIETKAIGLFPSRIRTISPSSIPSSASPYQLKVFFHLANLMI